MKTLLAAVVALMLTTQLAGAQNPPAPEPATQIPQNDLAGIRKALERLVVLLEQEQSRKNVDVIFRRIDLSLQENAPIEAERRGFMKMLDFTQQEVSERQAELQKLHDKQESADFSEGETYDSIAKQISLAEEELSKRRKDLARLKGQVDQLSAAAAAAEAERDEWKKLIDEELARKNP